MLLLSTKGRISEKISSMLHVCVWDSVGDPAVTPPAGSRSDPDPGSGTPGCMPSWLCCYTHRKKKEKKTGVESHLNPLSVHR